MNEKQQLDAIRLALRGACDSNLVSLAQATMERLEALEDKCGETAPVCEWQYDELDGSWEGTCGIKWTLIDGTPSENYMVKCPQCGYKLVEVDDDDIDADQMAAMMIG